MQITSSAIHFRAVTGSDPVRTALSPEKALSFTHPVIAAKRSKYAAILGPDFCVTMQLAQVPGTSLMFKGPSKTFRRPVDSIEFERLADYLSVREFEKPAEKALFQNDLYSILIESLQQTLGDLATYKDTSIQFQPPAKKPWESWTYNEAEFKSTLEIYKKARIKLSGYVGWPMN